MTIKFSCNNKCTNNKCLVKYNNMNEQDKLKYMKSYNISCLIAPIISSNIDSNGNFILECFSYEYT